MIASRTRLGKMKKTTRGFFACRKLLGSFPTGDPACCGSSNSSGKPRLSNLVPVLCLVAVEAGSKTFRLLALVQPFLRLGRCEDGLPDGSQIRGFCRAVGSRV